MNKIAIFVTSLRRGGAERVTLELAKYFTDQGIRCEIITLSVESEEEYKVPSNVERTSVGSANVFMLRRSIIKSSADLLLIMDIPACIFAIPASMGLRIKKVVSERNSPAHFSGKLYTRIISRFLMKYADGFVFQTEEAKAFYRKALKNRGRVIPNPLNIEFLPDPYLGENRDNLIVAVGRLEKQKNHELLIYAFAELHEDFQNYKLIIYGEGSLRNHLKSIIKNIGLEEYIKLPGNQINVIEIIRKATVFVMPSNYEGMPNALLEAMSVGLACISTDCPCGGPRSLIEDDKNGILVPVGEKEALKHALRYLLTNPGKIKELGKNAVKIRDILCFEKVGKQWLDYFETILVGREEFDE